jgi:hypothetical protein
LNEATTADPAPIFISSSDLLVTRAISGTPQSTSTRASAPLRVTRTTRPGM